MLITRRQFALYHRYVWRPKTFFFLCLSSVEQRRALMHAIFPRFSFLTNRKCKGLVLQALLAALDRFVCTSLCFLFSFNRNNVLEVDRQRTGRLGEEANRDTLSKRISPAPPLLSPPLSLRSSFSLSSTVTKLTNVMFFLSMFSTNLLCTKTYHL